MTVDRWIDLSKELKVDGLEFYWGFTPHDNDNELARLRMKVEDLGMTIPMMCYSPDFTIPGNEQRQLEIEKQKLAVVTSAKLGASFCRVLSGQARPELGQTEGVAMVADCIHQVLPIAREEGVTLILENHYKDGYWDFPEFAQKKEVFLALVDQIGDDPNFGINYDPSNAIVAGDDPIDLLEAVKDKVVTMHASDRWLDGGTLDDLRKMEVDGHQGYASILQHGIVGQGLNDYDKIFSILAECNFRGWISIEDGQDPTLGMEHLRESAIFLREMMEKYSVGI